MLGMFTPPDYKAVTEEFEARDLGVCGPCAIAAAGRKRVRKVIDDWGKPYKGYANVGDVERALRACDFETVRVRGGRSKSLFLPDEYDLGLAFVQWEGEYESWQEEFKETHWVFLRRQDGILHAFCNSNGWLREGTTAFRDYLKHRSQPGYVRSIVALRRRKRTASSRQPARVGRRNKPLGSSRWRARMATGGSRS